MELLQQLAIWVFLEAMPERAQLAIIVQLARCRPFHAQLVRLIRLLEDGRNRCIA